MNREKTLALLLLDLAGFAFSQSGDEDSRREFAAACGLVEKDSPFDAQVYRAHLEPGDQNGGGEQKRRSAQPSRQQSTADMGT